MDRGVWITNLWAVFGLMVGGIGLAVWSAWPEIREAVRELFHLD